MCIREGFKKKGVILVSSWVEGRVVSLEEVFFFVFSFALCSKAKLKGLLCQRVSDGLNRIDD